MMYLQNLRSERNGRPETEVLEDEGTDQAVCLFITNLDYRD